MRNLFVLGLVFVALGFAQSFGRPVYVIAPKAHILIRAPQSAQLNGRIFQVDSGGSITLPSIGRVRASGLTMEALEKELVQRLKASNLNEPQVTVSEVAYRHRP